MTERRRSDHPPPGGIERRRATSHSDFAGREVTRPGSARRIEVMSGELDDTHDDAPSPVIDPDKTPVEYLRAEVRHVEKRVADVETNIDLPSWEEFKEMRAEVAECKADRLRRAKWRRLLTVVKGLGIGSVFAALAFIATALRDSGSAAAKADARNVQIDRNTAAIFEIRATQQADHALLAFIAARVGLSLDTTPRTPPP